jgi:hypothetical protein
MFLGGAASVCMKHSSDVRLESGADVHLRIDSTRGMVMSASIRRLALCAAAWTATGTVRGATLVPDPSFGGGDGWRAPYEVLAGDAADTSVPDPTNPGVDPDRYRFLGYDVSGAPNTDPLESGVNAGNLERGLAYNAATGHLILVSRNDAGGTVPSVRILNATTGADVGSLDFGTGVVTGGLFVKNMIGVAEDGAIYMSNLSINTATSPYKIYRWANEAGTPTEAFSGQPGALLSGARLGDTLDVIGSGANTRLAAGYGSAPAVAGNESFSLFTTTDGVNFTANNVALSASGANTVPPAGNYRLGVTFRDSDTVLGKSDVNEVRLVDLTGTTTGTVNDTFTTAGISLKPMDFAVIAGKPILAVIEATADTTTARARVFVYDLTDTTLPLAERQIAVGSALPVAPAPPTQFANLNGTGQVKFGAINNNVATIYAMSTNNGIQALTLTLDLPPEEDANFNGDGAVDGLDFLTWQENYGTEDVATLATGDANGDGDVNDADFAVWTEQFGTTGLMSAAATGVPEPAAGLLAAIALAGIAARRRGKT